MTIRPLRDRILARRAVALICCQPALAALVFEDDRRYSVQHRRALEEPKRQVAPNCSMDGAIVVHAVLEGKGAFGYNARVRPILGCGRGRCRRSDAGGSGLAAERPSVALFMLATEALIAERPKHGTTASDQENS